MLGDAERHKKVLLKLKQLMLQSKKYPVQNQHHFRTSKILQASKVLLRQLKKCPAI